MMGNKNRVRMGRGSFQTLYRIVKPVFLLAILVIFFNIISYAQPAKERIILAIRVKGNQAISDATILSKIKTKPGYPFSQEIVNDDIKRLYALGYFTDVAVDVEDYEEGLMVTIIVEEKPVIKDIVFEGNEKISARRLKSVTQLSAGDMLQFSKLSDDIREIKSFYERNGFHRVSVKYELEKEEETNQVIVKIIIDEKARIRIKSVSLEGNESVKKNKILSLIKTKPTWWFLPFFRKGYLDDELFEEDLVRIKAYYQDQGFLDVSVTPKFDYDEEKGEMYITLVIDEGKEYKTGKIIIKGNIVFPEEEVRKKISLTEGKPFSFTILREDMENVRALYYHHGYMNAEILVDRVMKPEIQSLDVVYNIDARDPVYVGKVDIKGNTKTKDIVIRRELRTYPGERFDGDKIRRSKERLYNLGFFEDIFFETKPTSQPNVNDLEVTVKETKTGEFAFGGGYSSVDEFIGFVQITQKNFDLFNFPYFTGDGQSLSVRAELGTARTNYNVSWTEPWILDYPLSFGIDAFHYTHFRNTTVGYGYEETRTGGDVRFGKEFMEYIMTDLMYKLERVDISDISAEATQDLLDEEGDNWLSRVIGGVQFDNRDNIFSPTKGFVAGTSVENVGGFLLGDKDFLKGRLWSSLYFSPVELENFGKLVIELSGRAGVATEYWDTDKVPIYDRFYAGGATTIRGYRERKVGPRDTASNDAIGGEAMLIGNVELTFPIYAKILKGAVFYDVGNVWADIEDFAQGGYKQGVGVGIRVKTPIGPLSLDWGYPLNENEGDPREGQFYFSVSHGF